MQNNRSKGSEYEDDACRFLIDQGYRILERNFRTRSGEIDIIASDKEYTVFVEVKYRKTLKTGYPSEAVTLSKQKKIINTSVYYLYIKHKTNCNIRYDVIEIIGDSTINHYKNAFGGGII